MPNVCGNTRPPEQHQSMFFAKHQKDHLSAFIFDDQPFFIFLDMLEQKTQPQVSETKLTMNT